MPSLTQTLAVEEELHRTSLTWLYNRRVISESEFFNGNYNRAVLVPVYEEGEQKMASIIPRVTLTYLERLVTEVDVNENLRSMECVSHLYKTGIGLPRHERLAQIWREYSNLNPVYQNFDKVVRKLRTHVEDAQRNSPDGIYAYMDDFHMMDTVLRSALKVHPLEHAGQISKTYGQALRRGLIPEFESLTTTLAIEGVDVALMYRRLIDGTVVLVDGLIKEENKDSYTDLVTFPYLQQVRSIPAELANGDTKLVERVRTLTGCETDTIVVTGTLVLDADKRRKLKKIWPKVKTARDLVALWLDDWIEARDVVEEPPELEDLRKDYNLYFGTVVTDPKSESYGLLKEGKFHVLEREYRKSKERLLHLQKSSKRKKWKSFAKTHEELEHRYLSVKQDADLAREKYVACRKGYTDSIREERDARPERYFEFVATDVFGFTKHWKIVNFGLGSKTEAFITSLRFRALNHPGKIVYGVVPAKNAGNRSTYRKILRNADALYGDRYTITGLYVYPNKTVNIDSRTPKVFVPRVSCFDKS